MRPIHLNHLAATVIACSPATVLTALPPLPPQTSPQEPLTYCLPAHGDSLMLKQLLRRQRRTKALIALSAQLYNPGLDIIRNLLVRRPTPTLMNDPNISMLTHRTDQTAYLTLTPT